MKKIKQMFLTSLVIVMATAGKSQTWVKHGTGLMSPTGICIVDISTASTTVAWGILSVFSSGTCGGQVPYFTKTINGNSWVAGPIPLPAAHTPVCVSALNATTAWVATADISTNTSGAVYKTSNGGASWQQQSIANFTDAARFLHFFDANTGVVVGDSSIFITSNGGSTWSANGALPVPLSIVGTGSTQFLLNAYEIVGETIWLGDVYGNFYKSLDKGSTWFLLPNCIHHSVKGIAFRDQNYGIAVASVYIGGGSGSSGGADSDSSVFTTDGGITWSPMPIVFNSVNVDHGSAKYDVGYVPGTANTFVVTSEYDSSYAAFSAISTDGGVNWSLLDSTEQHTVCAFTGPNSGFTGGYIYNYSRGIFTLSGSLPTGEASISKDNELALYPNPANEYVELNEVSFANNSKYSISIIGMDAKVWISQDWPTPSLALKINLQNIPKGIYLLTLEQDGKRVKSYKLIH